MSYNLVGHRTLTSSRCIQRISALQIVSSWLNSSSSTVSSRSISSSSVASNFQGISISSLYSNSSVRYIHNERTINRQANEDNNTNPSSSSHSSPLPLPKVIDETEHFLRTIQEIQEQYEKIQHVLLMDNKVPDIINIQEKYITALQGLFNHGLMYECLMIIDKYHQFWNFYCITFQSTNIFDIPDTIRTMEQSISLQAKAWLNNQLQVSAPSTISPPVIQDNVLEHDKNISILVGNIVHQRWTNVQNFTGYNLQTKITNIEQYHNALEYILEGWLEYSRKYLSQISLVNNRDSITSYLHQFSKSSEGITLLYECINYYYTTIMTKELGILNHKYTNLRILWYRNAANLLQFFIQALQYTRNTHNQEIFNKIWSIINQQQSEFISFIYSTGNNNTNSLPTEQSVVLKQNITNVITSLPWLPNTYLSILRTAIVYKEITIVQQLLSQLDITLYSLWKSTTFNNSLLNDNKYLLIRNEQDIFKLLQDTLSKGNISQDTQKLYTTIIRILCHNNSNTNTMTTISAKINSIYNIQTYLPSLIIHTIIRLCIDNQQYDSILSLVQLLCRQYIITNIENKEGITYDQFMNKISTTNSVPENGLFVHKLDSLSFILNTFKWSANNNALVNNSENSSVKPSIITNIFPLLLINNDNTKTMAPSSNIDHSNQHPLMDRNILRGFIIALYHYQQFRDLFELSKQYENLWRTCIIEDMDYYLSNTSYHSGLPILNDILQLGIQENNHETLLNILTIVNKHYIPKTGSGKFTYPPNKYTPMLIQSLLTAFELVIPSITDSLQRIQLFERLLTMIPLNSSLTSETNKVIIKLICTVYRDKLQQANGPISLGGILQKISQRKIKISPPEGIQMLATLVIDNSFSGNVLIPFQFLHQLVQYNIVDNISSPTSNDGCRLIYSISAGLSVPGIEPNEQEFIVLQNILRHTIDTNILLDNISSKDFRILFGMINKQYNIYVNTHKEMLVSEVLQNCIQACTTLSMYGNIQGNKEWTPQDFTDLYRMTSYVLSTTQNKGTSSHTYLARTLRVLLEKYNANKEILYPLSVSSAALEDVVYSLFVENEGWTLTRVLSNISIPGSPAIPLTTANSLAILHNPLSIPAAIHARFTKAFEKNLGILHLAASSSGTSSNITDIYRYVTQNLEENIEFNTTYGKLLSNIKPFTMTGTKSNITGTLIPWVSLAQGKSDPNNKLPNVYRSFDDICSTTTNQRVDITTYPNISKLFPWASNVDMNDYHLWNSIASTGGAFNVSDETSNISSTSKPPYFIDPPIESDTNILQKVSAHHVTSLIGHCLTEAKPLFPTLIAQLLRHGVFIVPSIADQIAILTKDYPSFTLPLLAHLRLQFVTVIGNLPWSLMAQTKVPLSGSGCSSIGLNAILESLIKSRQLLLALELLDELAPISKQIVAGSKSATVKMTPVNWWAPDVQILQQLQALAEELQEKQVAKMITVLIRSMVKTVQEHPHERKPVGVRSTV